MHQFISLTQELTFRIQEAMSNNQNFHPFFPNPFSNGPSAGFYAQPTQQTSLYPAQSTVDGPPQNQAFFNPQSPYTPSAPINTPPPRESSNQWPSMTYPANSYMPPLRNYLQYPTLPLYGANQTPWHHSPNPAAKAPQYFTSTVAPPGYAGAVGQPSEYNHPAGVASIFSYSF
jgi:hypothetical protein